MLVAPVPKDTTLLALLLSLTTTILSSTIPTNLRLTRAIPHTARNAGAPRRRQIFQRNCNALPAKPLNVPRKGNHAVPLRSSPDKLDHELLNDPPTAQRA